MPHAGFLPVQAARWAEGFRDAAVRRGFIRKVLGIVAVMLAFTAGCSLVFFFVQPLKARRPPLAACSHVLTPARAAHSWIV
jgi:hypothetical protein